MKKLALCILTLGVASSAFGAACAQVALSTYDVGGFSCTVGSYTFNNFSYIALNVLSTNVPASQIIVDPTAGVNGPNVTFTPNTPFTASGVASVADYIFGFTVTSTNPLIGFKSVNLNTTGDTTGLGVAAVVEADCYGGLLQVPNIVTGIVGLGCLKSIRHHLRPARLLADHPRSAPGGHRRRSSAGDLRRAADDTERVTRRGPASESSVKAHCGVNSIKETL
jgi:hypothetical protein